MWKVEVVEGASLDLEEVAEVYRASTLASRRPVADRDRFGAMIRQANLVITARKEGELIGFCRGLTDWCYVTYLSDLAVDVKFQRQGVGRDLIKVAQEAAPGAKIVLLAAPAATEYYPRIGFSRHDSAWVLNSV